MNANPQMMIEELTTLPATHAPTMGRLEKVSYTHLDMIDYMICNPGWKLEDLARRYGYSVGWICNIQASDAWKSAFAARRAAISDPIVENNVKERMEGVTLLSLERLRQKLEAPVVSDQVVLRAVELGARGLGLGGNAAPVPPPSTGDHLARLAERLIELQSKVRQQGVTINGQAEVVQDAG